jgi:mRNA interferase YafQ
MAAYFINFTNRYRKSVRRCEKRGYDVLLLEAAIRILSETGTLPPKYKPHQLHGNYSSVWECHIKPDWLLLWRQNDTELTLLFVDTGTHSDIF